MRMPNGAHGDVSRARSNGTRPPRARPSRATHCDSVIARCDEDTADARCNRTGRDASSWPCTTAPRVAQRTRGARPFLRDRARSSAYAWHVSSHSCYASFVPLSLAVLGSGMALGLLGGMRHALEPDHLAAVCTLVAERPSWASTTRYAVLWAAGHSAVLALAGMALFSVRQHVPAAFSGAAEIGVALLLMALGLRALWRSRVPQAPHVRAAMPFGIGMLHGLAGSGAFTVWLAGAAASALGALGVLASYAFGLGLSMCAAALLARSTLVHVGSLALQRAMALSGLLSFGVGAWWLWVQ